MRLAEGRWTFRGLPIDAGYALYNGLEEEQRAVAVAPPQPSEAAAILALAQAAFGELRGLLAGLDDDLLDRSPAAGEWTLRETLAHVIGVERSYRTNAEYAIHRAASDPLPIPDARRTRPDPAHTAGGVAEIVDQLAAQRALTDATFAGLGPDALARPAIWVRYEVDVRFRLHRFAAHLAEHAGQCAKALAALGASGGDARAIARRIGATRGMHERRSSEATLTALDAALAEKVRALGA